MRTGEIFTRISTHQIEGMMLHDQMADAFAFLALPGFKRMHEYRFAEETKSMREVHAYFIEHCNMLLDEGRPEDPKALPRSWHGYTRQQVSYETKRKAVREMMERWVEWERETKACYEKAYAELTECNEVMAACFVKGMLEEVTEELAFAEELYLRMHGTDFDMPYVDQMMDSLHNEFSIKLKKLYLGTKQH